MYFNETSFSFLTELLWALKATQGTEITAVMESTVQAGRTWTVPRTRSVGGLRFYMLGKTKRFRAQTGFTCWCPINTTLTSYYRCPPRNTLQPFPKCFGEVRVGKAQKTAAYPKCLLILGQLPVCILWRTKPPSHMQNLGKCEHRHKSWIPEPHFCFNSPTLLGTRHNGTMVAHGEGFLLKIFPPEV